jgi:hypothetical protein
MTSPVTVHYPNPTDCEQAVLLISACRLGDYVTAGQSEMLRIPISYDHAKDLSAQLYKLPSGLGWTVDMKHDDGVLKLDGLLAAEVYAALIEIIVDVELGEDLAMIEVAERTTLN